MNWRKEQLTFIEHLLGVFGFTFIGYGIGIFMGAEFGETLVGTPVFYALMGWGVALIAPLLLVLRYRIKPKKEG